jgi:amino acid transporter
VAGSVTFVRKASGLVRRASVFDAFIISFGCANLLGLATIYTWIPAQFQGSNILLALLICTVGLTFHILIYAMFSAAIPRSGGEYVFVSRSIHPALGFTMNWSMMVFQPQFIAWCAMITSKYSLSSLFSILAYRTNNPGLFDYAAWAGSNVGAFIVGVVVILIEGLLMMWGQKKFMWYVGPLVLIATIGSVAAIAVIVGAGNAAFQTAFNSLMVGASSYQNEITTAGASGWGPNPDLLGATSIFFFTLGFAYWSSYMMGEVKGADSMKNQMMIQVGSLWLCAVFLFGMAIGIINTVGQEFAGAAEWNWWTGASKLATEPTSILWSGILAPNTWVAFFIALAFVFWGATYGATTMTSIPRCMFAWSFDRIMPRWLSDVNARTYTPVKGIAVSTIASLLFLVGWVFTPYFAILAVFVFAGSLQHIVTGLSGTVFPFRRKDLYSKSPCKKWEIRGFPLMTIFGVVDVVFMSIITVYLLLQATIPYGLVNVPSIIIGSAAWVSGPIVYYFAKWYRAREGIDIGLAFKEIPPA